MKLRHVAGGCLLALVAGSGLAAAQTTPPLIEAVKAGNRALARTLVRTKAAVDAPEADGTTALQWAVRGGDVEMMRLLLDAGANPKIANRYGVTPLSLAAVNGDAAAMEPLIKAGADVNATVAEGQTVLMTAARTGDPAALEVLLAHGAAVNAHEQWLGETAVMWAAAQDHPEAVKVLARHGADLNAKSNPLKFPKFVYNASTMVTTPLPRGGMTALHIAARQGAVDGARALIEAGADLNLTDPDGTTPLVMAIINRHNDLAKILIEKGADPNIRDSSKMGALYAAVDVGYLGGMLNRPTPKPTGMVENLELVTRLLEHGADPNAQLSLPTLPRYHTSGDKQLAEGATPLMRAAKASDMRTMKVLLEHGANPNLQTRNFMTPMIFVAGGGGRVRASEKDTIEALKILLDHGADVNAFDSTGSTPLLLAVTRGDELVKFLVSRGADLEVRDKQGRNALDVAMGVNKGFTGARTEEGAGPARAASRPTTVALLKSLMGGPSAEGTAPPPETAQPQ